MQNNKCFEVFKFQAKESGKEKLAFNKNFNQYIREYPEKLNSEIQSVGIIGPNKIGKSTILNDIFQSSFPSGVGINVRESTTKNVLCTITNDDYLIFDSQGFYGTLFESTNTRELESKDFEISKIMFIISEIIILYFEHTLESQAFALTKKVIDEISQQKFTWFTRKKKPSLFLFFRLSEMPNDFEDIRRDIHYFTKKVERFLKRNKEMEKFFHKIFTFVIPPKVTRESRLEEALNLKENNKKFFELFSSSSKELFEKIPKKSPSVTALKSQLDGADKRDDYFLAFPKYAMGLSRQCEKEFKKIKMRLDGKKIVKVEVKVEEQKEEGKEDNKEEKKEEEVKETSTEEAKKDIEKKENVEKMITLELEKEEKVKIIEKIVDTEETLEETEKKKLKKQYKKLKKYSKYLAEQVQYFEMINHKQILLSKKIHQEQFYPLIIRKIRQEIKNLTKSLIQQVRITKKKKLMEEIEKENTGGGSGSLKKKSIFNVLKTNKNLLYNSFDEDDALRNEIQFAPGESFRKKTLSPGPGPTGRKVVTVNARKKFTEKEFFCLLDWESYLKTIENSVNIENFLGKYLSEVYEDSTVSVSVKSFVYEEIKNYILELNKISDLMTFLNFKFKKKSLVKRMKKRFSKEELKQFKKRRVEHNEKNALYYRIINHIEEKFNLIHRVMINWYKELYKSIEMKNMIRFHSTLRGKLSFGLPKNFFYLAFEKGLNIFFHSIKCQFNEALKYFLSCKDFPPESYLLHRVKLPGNSMYSAIEYILQFKSLNDILSLMIEKLKNSGDWQNYEEKTKLLFFCFGDLKRLSGEIEKVQNLNAIKILLKNDVSVRAKENGNNLLHFAVKQESLEMVHIIYNHLLNQYIKDDEDEDVTNNERELKFDFQELFKKKGKEETNLGGDEFETMKKEKNKENLTPKELCDSLIKKIGKNHEENKVKSKEKLIMIDQFFKNRKDLYSIVKNKIKKFEDYEVLKFKTNPIGWIENMLNERDEDRYSYLKKYKGSLGTLVRDQKQFVYLGNDRLLKKCFLSEECKEWFRYVRTSTIMPRREETFNSVVFFYPSFVVKKIFNLDSTELKTLVGLYQSSTNNSIIKLHGFFITNYSLNLFFTSYSYTLKSFTDRMKQVRESLTYFNSTCLKEFFRDSHTLIKHYLSVCLLKSVDFIHEHELIHKDIKPENIFISFDNKTGEINLFLGDWGSAKKHQDFYSINMAAQKQNYLKMLNGITFLTNVQSAFLNDIYSLGITLNYLWTNEIIQLWERPNFVELENYTKLSLKKDWDVKRLKDYLKENLFEGDQTNAIKNLILSCYLVFDNKCHEKIPREKRKFITRLIKRELEINFQKHCQKFVDKYTKDKINYEMSSIDDDTSDNQIDIFSTNLIGFFKKVNKENKIIEEQRNKENFDVLKEVSRIFFTKESFI